MQNSALQKVEQLSRQRLNLVRQFAAAQASALRSLDGDDVEGFARGIRESDALIAQIDEIGAQFDEQVAALGAGSAASIRAVFSAGGAGRPCPGWAEALGQDAENMRRLLRDCAEMSRKMEAQGKAVRKDIGEHLNRVRMSRKINRRYQIKQTGSAGSRISAIG